MNFRLIIISAGAFASQPYQHLSNALSWLKNSRLNILESPFSVTGIRNGLQLAKDSFSTEDGNVVFYQGLQGGKRQETRSSVYLIQPQNHSLFMTNWQYKCRGFRTTGYQDGINYLVESGNNLFRVWTYRLLFTVWTDWLLPSPVCVYKPDDSRHKWKETSSLSGRCFFCFVWHSLHWEYKGS